MKFNNEKGEVYIYNGRGEADAFAATTHLCIAAHQDDVEFMAYAGIAECFGAEDKNFSAVIMTNGAGSPRSGIYEKYTDSEMIEVRKTEQKKAALIGEYSTLSLLMYSSKEIKDKDDPRPVNDLVKILTAAKPKVVYLHNLADKHETHVAVALRAVAALRALPKELRPEKVYGCEVWRALDWLPDDKKVKLDVGSRENLAAALMGVFDSQISGGKRYDTAVVGRRAANATFADDHAVDTFTAVTYAMDLTPLLDKDINISDYVTAYIDDFKNDVAAKLKYAE